MCCKHCSVAVPACFLGSAVAAASIACLLALPPLLCRVRTGKQHLCTSASGLFTLLLLLVSFLQEQTLRACRVDAAGRPAAGAAEAAGQPTGQPGQVSVDYA